MAQMIFVNLRTGTQHLFRVGIMFSHIPRIGEEVMIYSDYEDDETVIEGKVEGVNWSFGNNPEDGESYSVFFDIRPREDNEEDEDNEDEGEAF